MYSAGRGELERAIHNKDGQREERRGKMIRSTEEDERVGGPVGWEMKVRNEDRLFSSRGRVPRPLRFRR
jgi:hypothetical protein